MISENDKKHILNLKSVVKGHSQILGKAVTQLSCTIDDAVRNGATWKEIGELLGISKQAAWSRYRQ